LRIRSSASPGEAEYLDYLKRQVRAWSATDIAQLKRSLDDVERQLPRLSTPLPQPILLIHTTDEVEEGAPHTRGTAIVLPDSTLRMPPDRLQHVLFHELFHILTRSDPDLRDRLYRLIGFSLCGRRLELPNELASRLVTNPDAPRSLHRIRVSIAGKPRFVVPL